MVAESDLVARLREILRDSDLDKATAGSVRRQLEGDFGVDLSDRKAFIREQIDVYLQDLGGGEDADGDGENVKAEEGEADAAEAEEEEDEEGTEGNGSRKRRKKSGKESKRTGGFNKLCSLSPQLQTFVGVPALARPQVVKKIWSYIREKDLQDPKDKRKILCDEVLYGLFRVKSINMFQMNKALAKHILPLNPEDETVYLKAENEENADSRSTEEGNNSAKEIEEEGEEDEEMVEEGVNGRGRKKRRSSKGDKAVKKKGGGFTKVCALSPQLQVFTGVPHMARTEVVKKLWSYIRENSLQDPKNKRTIICDDTLRALFDVDSIDMFQMNKALSKHIWALNGEEASVCQKMDTEEAGGSSSAEETSDAAREVEEEGEEEEDGGEEQETSKRGGRIKRASKEDKGIKKRGGGFSKVCSLSEQLQAFTGVCELARTEVVKKLWSYIRENNLQDPSNKRRILCDESLRALFKVDSIDMFQMNKALSKHIWPLNEEEASDKLSRTGVSCKRARDEDEGEEEDNQQKECSTLVSS